jgi:NAD(P)H-dependent FMN reductase
MPKIVGLAGSLRKASFNASLLRAVAQLAPQGTTVEIGSIRGIPLYDGDLEEASGIPDRVRELKDQIAAADGLLIATPEYNNAMPGVLKNAIDWLTRPPADIARVFGNKPVAIIGATPGPGGTLLAQSSWLPVLRTLKTHAWFGGRLTVSNASKVFDAEGNLTDDKTKEQVRAFVAGFAAFIGDR